MKKIIITTVTILLLVNITLAQTAFMKLTPGLSKRAESERVLGKPVTPVSETLFEYRPQQNGQKIYVQYSAASVIDRIEVIFDTPIARSAIAGMIGVAEAETTKWDSKGRLEEYFGSTHLIVLTHESSEKTSPVIRTGYYSKELFEVALQKPQGEPVAKTAATSAATSPAKAKTRSAEFKDVDLLIPKGDKADEKSVRLLFDGDTLVIDADRGEKIYKSFPYTAIKSAEYSYSNHPRWKTAVGATILLGVFALPLFFMKSKKHWLTIKTADDFAVLRLDKKNYKMILPTFETSTGTKVETVADDK